MLNAAQSDKIKMFLEGYVHHSPEWPKSKDLCVKLTMDNLSNFFQFCVTHPTHQAGLLFMMISPNVVCAEEEQQASDDTDSGSDSNVSQLAAIVTEIMTTYPPNIKYDHTLGVFINPGNSSHYFFITLAVVELWASCWVHTFQHKPPHLGS
ncbi:hypothetical protein CROQUDRAFT_91892 [Cronartium quercuum f. sp. fusiforme G11]|uniref:Uncharacterized protein n=1 Tax=Cronartium quercuum f. sp. fusiforme G11 TaxID=708437 RepID=A0A9P6NP51_9BASI|nr:hypothetical protein CROQUDRAFT_91892 [Cronartium quercuum f. sp. fusiforme G11]